MIVTGVRYRRGRAVLSEFSRNCYVQSCVVVLIVLFLSFMVYVRWFAAAKSKCLWLEIRPFCAVKPFVFSKAQCKLC